MNNLIILFSFLILSLAIRRWRTRARLLPPSPVSLPFIGHLHLLGPLIHRSFNRLSHHHGPIISLKLGSTLAIVVSSPDLAQEFLKTHELTFSSRKHTIATKRLTYNDSAYAFAPYGQYWKFINKICVTNLLNPRALSQFHPSRNDELRRFIRILSCHSRDSSSVNVSHELMKLAYNIISNMMFGGSCSDRGSDHVLGLVREVTKLFGEVNVSDFVSLVKGLDLQRFHPRIEDVHMRYDSLLEAIITEREELRKQQKGVSNDVIVVKDFLSLLLDAMEDEGSEIKITRENIKALILDFLTAATDTSAISIEWSLAELVSNPRTLKKARDEIAQVVGTDRLVHESDLQNLPYLQAVIKEAYRLHPPIPMIIRKSMKPSQVKGYHIPENTLVFINSWAMGRDPKYWDGPTEFRPERFLQPSNGDPMGLVELRGQNFNLLPFGSGRRGCPGINLALLEVPTVLAALVQCFDWMHIDASVVVDMKEQPGLTAPRVHELECIPVPGVDMSKILA